MLDSVSYSEELAAAKSASSDSFVEFAEKAVDLISADEVAKASVKVLVEKAKKLNLTYHGLPVSDNTARALQAMAPYLTATGVDEAFKQFQEISGALDDQTKISTVMSLTTKHFGKGNLEAAAGALVTMIKALRWAIIYKDIEKDSHLTKEFLVGGRGKAGFAHVFFGRLTLLQYIRTIVESATGEAGAEANEFIFPKMLKLEDFVSTFAVSKAVAAVGAAGAGSGQEVEDSGDEANMPSGLATATAKELNGKFIEKISQSGKLLAGVLAAIHSCGFDDEFRAIANAGAANPNFSFPWPALLSATESPDEKVGGISLPQLRGACNAWVQSTLSQPVSAGAAIGAEDIALRTANAPGVAEPGDGEDVSETVEQVKKLFGRHVRLTTVGDNPTNPGLCWTKAVNVLRRFIVTKENNAAASAVGEDKSKTNDDIDHRGGTMYLCGAELFSGHYIKATPEAFRGCFSAVGEPFKILVEVLARAKGDNDVVVVGDGRDETARKAIREVLAKVDMDSAKEVWVVYEMEGSIAKDIRLPKRKLPFSSDNLETLFVVLQHKRNGKRRKLVSRDLFAKSGEATNFSRSYTGVPFRNLAEIPRLTEEGKVEILGAAAIGAFNKGRVEAEVVARGHPLFWGEWKPVPLYSTLIRDLGVANVIDATPGSGAAALGALYAGVPYGGVACNTKHCLWLEDLLQRAFVALVFDKDVTADPELVGRVGQYLERAAQQARTLLPGKNKIVAECATAVDDSGSDTD